MRPTAIIIDDESTLISYLSNKLARLWPELEILGSAVNGRQGLALAAQVQPDIVFLDIQMPGLSGLQVAQALSADIKIVFVTAYDEFAVDAFERAAVDYLLKPVSDERLQQSIERLQQARRQDHQKLLSLLQDISPARQEYLHWIRTGVDDTTSLVAVDDVVYFQADQKYTSVITADREYVVRRSIKELEQQLDPAQFWRIHRGTIVRVDQIVKARRDLRGRYSLTLRSRPETLRSSASYGHVFKQM
ncbi:MAG: LytR/AlgR family response regulator transcription factor [bacterium]